MGWRRGLRGGLLARRGGRARGGVWREGGWSLCWVGGLFFIICWRGLLLVGGSCCDERDGWLWCGVLVFSWLVCVKFEFEAELRRDWRSGGGNLSGPVWFESRLGSRLGKTWGLSHSSHNYHNSLIQVVWRSKTEVQITQYVQRFTWNGNHGQMENTRCTCGEPSALV